MSSRLPTQPSPDSPRSAAPPLVSPPLALDRLPLRVDRHRINSAA